VEGLVTDGKRNNTLIPGVAVTHDQYMDSHFLHYIEALSLLWVLYWRFKLFTCSLKFFTNH